jgi:hypothetical protein
MPALLTATALIRLAVASVSLSSSRAASFNLLCTEPGVDFAAWVPSGGLARLVCQIGSLFDRHYVDALGMPENLPGLQAVIT